MKNIIKRIVIIAAIAALSAGVTRAYMIQTAAPSGAGKFTAINKSKPGQSRLFPVALLTDHPCRVYCGYIYNRI